MIIFFWSPLIRFCMILENSNLKQYLIFKILHHIFNMYKTFNLSTFVTILKSQYYYFVAVYFLTLPISAPFVHSSYIVTANFILFVVIFGTSDAVLGPFVRHPIKFLKIFFSVKKRSRWQIIQQTLNLPKYPYYKYVFKTIFYFYLSSFLTIFILQPYAYLISPYYAYTHFLDPSPLAIFAYFIQFLAWAPIIISFVTLPSLYELYQTGYFLPIKRFLIDVVRSFSVILPLLLGVAFFTLYERKILAAVQLRRGPDSVGFIGLLQPIADAIKLLFKELIVPLPANKTIFIFAPILTFFFAFFGVLMFPFYTFDVIFDFELTIILFFGLSSIGIFGIILSGWASNSRYAFLGSLRSTAQMISYEVSLGITLQTVCLPVSSLAFFDIVNFQISYNIWFIFPFFFSFVLFVISTLAEVNRPPFDLPEAEAELVSGYNVEYSSSTFALFFIGEYANVIVSSLVSVFFFFGGSGTTVFAPLVLSFKLLFFLSFFILIRAALPRFRYDQLIMFGWKGILPISFGWFVFSTTLFYAFSILSCFADRLSKFAL